MRRGTYQEGKGTSQEGGDKEGGHHKREGIRRGDITRGRG